MRSASVRRRLRPSVPALLAALVLAVAGTALVGTAQARFWFQARPMPEFANQSKAVWINSKPLTRADLRGKVVLIEVWTSI